MELNTKPLVYLSADELSSLIKSAVNEALSQKAQPEFFDHKELLTIKEASLLLSLSVPTLYTMNCRKLIPYTKLSGKIFYRRSVLFDWLATGDRKTNAQLMRELKAK